MVGGGKERMPQWSDEKLGSGSVAQFEIVDIGKMLGSIGYLTGIDKVRASLQPGDGEADVRMKREEFKRLAWLADEGYWLHVDPRYDGVRAGQRFSKYEAELTTSLLDDFDRKIVADLFFTNETPEEKEERFTQHENRIKSIIGFYG